MTKECGNCKHAVDVESEDIQCNNRKSIYFKELVTSDFGCEKFKNKKEKK